MAKRTKGLSIEQKREKMLSIFHERVQTPNHHIIEQTIPLFQPISMTFLIFFFFKQEVFNLKDIEKFSTKAGIGTIQLHYKILLLVNFTNDFWHILSLSLLLVLPTVKDVLMMLISDGLVDSDKIGSANFYWSLPSQSLIIVRFPPPLFVSFQKTPAPKERKHSSNLYYFHKFLLGFLKKTAKTATRRSRGKNKRMRLKEDGFRSWTRNILSWQGAKCNTIYFLHSFISPSLSTRK